MATHGTAVFCTSQVSVLKSEGCSVTKFQSCYSFLTTYVAKSKACSELKRFSYHDIKAFVQLHKLTVKCDLIASIRDQLHIHSLHYKHKDLSSSFMHSYKPVCCLHCETNYSYYVEALQFSLARSIHPGWGGSYCFNTDPISHVLNSYTHMYTHTFRHRGAGKVRSIFTWPNSELVCLLFSV